MYAPSTRHHRTNVEERCWRDEREFRCAKLESLSDRTQNCGIPAGCWHNWEEAYPQIEMQVSHCRRTATSLQLLVSSLRFSECDYLSLLTLTCRFHAVATLDYVCLEGNRPRCAMKLKKEATCIAKNRSHLVTSPERSCGCGTVLTYRLQISRLAVSK